MPSTVAAVMGAAGIEPAGTVAWGERVPVDQPGVYAVSLSANTTSPAGALSECPVNAEAIDELLGARPELTMDGTRPSGEALAERLAEFWLADEVILYLGLAGTSLRKRVGQYYGTPLGARSPHAGGWFLKTLEVLPRLYVHYSPAVDPNAAESAMIEAFCSAVSPSVSNQLRDPDHPFPFANLEWPRGVRKAHGIKGAKAARR